MEVSIIQGYRGDFSFDYISAELSIESFFHRLLSTNKIRYKKVRKINVWVQQKGQQTSVNAIEELSSITHVKLPYRSLDSQNVNLYRSQLIEILLDAFGKIDQFAEVKKLHEVSVAIKNSLDKDGNFQVELIRKKNVRDNIIYSVVSVFHVFEIRYFFRIIQANVLVLNTAIFNGSPYDLFIENLFNKIVIRDNYLAVHSLLDEIIFKIDVVDKSSCIELVQRIPNRRAGFLEKVLHAMSAGPKTEFELKYRVFLGLPVGSNLHNWLRSPTGAGLLINTI